MSQNDDTDLKTFLQRYRPIAPEAPHREFSTIMDRIDAKARRRHHYISLWWRIAIPVTVTACLAFFIVANFKKEPTTRVAIADDAALQDFLSESYTVVDNGNGDLNVGDEWLQLAL